MLTAYLLLAYRLLTWPIPVMSPLELYGTGISIELHMFSSDINLVTITTTCSKLMAYFTLYTLVSTDLVSR